MPPRNLVVRSINNADASRCVDVFRRPDGSFGFEEFRRDAEDGRGWFPVGLFGDAVYDDAHAALAAAGRAVPWLRDVAEFTSGLAGRAD